MKKIIVLLMVLLLTLCMLVACGDSTTDTDSVDTSTDTSADTSKPSQSTCTHEFGEWEVLRAATCTAKGMDKRYCKKCGFMGSRSVDAKGHTAVKDEAIPGSCTQDGYSEGVHCGVCNAVLQAQTVISKDQFHKFDKLVSVEAQPTLSSGGSATFRCSECDAKSSVSLPKLTATTLGKSDVYDITAPEYNPAIDNIWKVVDGNKNTAGLYNTGDDWFGNVGDTLVITLKQEIVLTELKLYTAGNWTFADVVVKNAKGQQTAKKSVNANGAAYGGTGEQHTVVSNSSIKAYTIEITIRDNKNSYMNFKVAEVEIKGAKTDTRLPHDHVYREYVEDTVKATCSETGKANFACYCGLTTEKSTPIIDHSYTVLHSVKEATCTENGRYTYKCETCNNKREKQIYAKGHIYEKLVTYISMPTLGQKGEATFKCIGCDLTQNKNIIPLALGNVEHLRVSSVLSNSVTLKFNVYGESANYEVRYSTSEINSDNFEGAAPIDATVTGDGEYTVKVDLSISLSSCYYLAIRPYIGENYGEVTTIRLGGDKLIEIDYENANVYSGEVLNSFAKLFDEQKAERTKEPTSALAKIFNDTSDLILYGSKLRPIVDLEAKHFVSNVYLYFADAGNSVTVRYSETPVDFMAEDREWDGVYNFTTVKGWNEIKISKTTRYIQVIFKDGQAPYEMLIYGFQNGEGDKIETEIGSLPTMGEMMGMCGFTAIGGGNTPIDSVSCTTVLRDYRKVEWGYTISKYPSLASFFNGFMGNFDSAYKSYTQAGINVIPCIQWDLVNTSLCYKVDSNNLPRKSGKDFIKGDFWDKFNPHTFFVYADHMFAFAARYGSNASMDLLEYAKYHMDDTSKVGLNYITWLELGNEPDGGWNGIHNYYSAYQLAALTSAAYDGHCRTMVSSETSKGYHLGLKNADPNMRGAMAGVSAVSNEYITAMCYWMKANRDDGKVAFDAFNVHHYMTKQITLSNGLTYTVGACPEESGIKDVLAKLVAYRDKYYSEKEVWITEFGWDTNQSYATVTSSHGYENKDTGVSYTGRQVQAMWLTRAYLLISSTGVDKATMYMCEDVGTVENEAVGKYATAGVIGFMYDENGSVIEFKKDSYYYLYTLKNTLGDYTFTQEIKAYDENVMIYQYKTAEGKTAYAVWCGTSDGSVSNNYQLKIDGSSATLVENEYGDIDGVKTTLTADSLGYVSVNVSENPVYIVVD